MGAARQRSLSSGFAGEMYFTPRVRCRVRWAGRSSGIWGGNSPRSGFSEWSTWGRVAPKLKKLKAIAMSRFPSKR